MKKKPQNETTEVFRRLGLETELDRQRVLQLAELGHATSAAGPATFPTADTRNNTRQEDDDAQLESTS
jgi:hypothetical protein